MTHATPSPSPDTELEQTAWDLDPLVNGAGPDGARAQLTESLERAQAFAASYAGKLAELDSAGLERAMRELGEIQDLV
ncbi:MAG: oligoendopeptidase, partial [Solirubrobacteraceae bacterium]